MRSLPSPVNDIPYAVLRISALDLSNIQHAATVAVGPWCCHGVVGSWYVLDIQGVLHLTVIIKWCAAPDTGPDSTCKPLNDVRHKNRMHHVGKHTVMLMYSFTTRRYQEPRHFSGRSVRPQTNYSRGRLKVRAGSYILLSCPLGRERVPYPGPYDCLSEPWPLRLLVPHHDAARGLHL